MENLLFYHNKKILKAYVFICDFKKNATSKLVK